jgi:hypothetical protein
MAPRSQKMSRRAKTSGGDNPTSLDQNVFLGMLFIIKYNINIFIKIYMINIFKQHKNTFRIAES